MILHGVVGLVMVMAYQIRTKKTAPVLILQGLHCLPSEFPDGCDVASRPVDVPNEHLPYEVFIIRWRYLSPDNVDIFVKFHCFAPIVYRYAKIFIHQSNRLT